MLPSRLTETKQTTIDRYNRISWLNNLQINLKKVRMRIIKQKLHDPLVPQIITQDNLEKAQLLIEHKEQLFTLLQTEPQNRVIQYLDINRETMFLVMFYLTRKEK